MISPRIHHFKKNIDMKTWLKGPNRWTGKSPIDSPKKIPHVEAMGKSMHTMNTLQER